MTFWEEVQKSIRAVAWLARFDPNGMNELNLTIEGFWRSFSAAVLLAPFVVMTNTMLLHSIPQLQPESFTISLTISAITKYVLLWVLFPVIMIFVTRLLGAGERYVSYIIAYNWSNVVKVGIYFILAALAASGVVSEGAFLALSLAAFVYVLIFMVYITRIGLEVFWITATGIVCLNLIITIFLEAGMNLISPGI